MLNAPPSDRLDRQTEEAEQARDDAADLRTVASYVLAMSDMRGLGSGVTC